MKWVLALCLWLGLAQGNGVRGQDTLRLSSDLILPAERFGRVVGVATDAAGRLFVADNASHQIYLFDAQGHALDTLGGPGEGPGEFKMGLWGIAYEPATAVLYAFETVSNRLHAWKLHPEVRFLDTRTLTAPSAPMAGLLEIWAWGPDPLIVRLLSIQKSGQLSQALWMYQWSSQQLSRLFSLPHSATGNTGVTAELLPFMARALVAVHPSIGIATLWTDSLVVRLYDLAGRQRSNRSLPLTYRAPISQEDWEQAIAQVRRLAPPGFPLKLPERSQYTHWPYVNALLLDDRGRIWVRIEQGSLPQAPRQTTIYWAEELGFIALDGDVTLKTIHHGRAWGIQTDPDGLTSVVRYRLPAGQN